MDETDPFAGWIRPEGQKVYLPELTDAVRREPEPFVLPDLTETVGRRPKRSEIAAARLKVALARSSGREVETWVQALAAIPLTEGRSTE